MSTNNQDSIYSNIEESEQNEDTRRVSYIERQSKPSVIFEPRNASTSKDHVSSREETRRVAYSSEPMHRRSSESRNESSSEELRKRSSSYEPRYGSSSEEVRKRSSSYEPRNGSDSKEPSRLSEVFESKKGSDYHELREGTSNREPRERSDSPEPMNGSRRDKPRGRSSSNETRKGRSSPVSTIASYSFDKLKGLFNIYSLFRKASSDYDRGEGLSRGDATVRKGISHKFTKRSSSGNNRTYVYRGHSPHHEDGEGPTSFSEQSGDFDLTHKNTYEDSAWSEGGNTRRLRTRTSEELREQTVDFYARLKSYIHVYKSFQEFQNKRRKNSKRKTEKAHRRNSEICENQDCSFFFRLLSMLWRPIIHRDTSYATQFFLLICYAGVLMFLSIFATTVTSCLHDVLSKYPAPS